MLAGSDSDQDIFLEPAVALQAAWCGPCKQLGPKLEAAVKKSGKACVYAWVLVDTRSTAPWVVDPRRPSLPRRPLGTSFLCVFVWLWHSGTFCATAVQVILAKIDVDNPDMERVVQRLNVRLAMGISRSSTPEPGPSQAPCRSPRSRPSLCCTEGKLLATGSGTCQIAR